MFKKFVFAAVLILTPAFAQTQVEVVNGPKQPIPVVQQPLEVFV